MSSDRSENNKALERDAASSEVAERSSRPSGGRSVGPQSASVIVHPSALKALRQDVVADSVSGVLDSPDTYVDTVVEPRKSSSPYFADNLGRTGTDITRRTNHVALVIGLLSAVLVVGGLAAYFGIRSMNRTTTQRDDVSNNIPNNIPNKRGVINGDGSTKGRRTALDNGSESATAAVELPNKDISPSDTSADPRDTVDQDKEIADKIVEEPEVNEQEVADKNSSGSELEKPRVVGRVARTRRRTRRRRGRRTQVFSQQRQRDNDIDTSPTTAVTAKPVAESVKPKVDTKQAAAPISSSTAAAPAPPKPKPIKTPPPSRPPVGSAVVSSSIPSAPKRTVSRPANRSGPSTAAVKKVKKKPEVKSAPKKPAPEDDVPRGF